MAAGSQSPRLSIHMMVRDGAKTVGRALRSLVHEGRCAADELVLVDTGSTDGTVDAAQATCREIGLGFAGVAFSPASRSDLYFPDVPESYARKVPFPHSGKLLLRDWAAARNLGLALCRGKYVCKLDADDVCLHPEAIPAVLDELDRNEEVDLGVGFYEVMGDCHGTPGRVPKPSREASLPAELAGSARDPIHNTLEYTTLGARLWRRLPEIRFREVCHENVDWWRRGEGNRCLPYERIRNLVFRDLRDGGERVPGRNYKVLLREYERDPAAASSHLLLYLADEACWDDPELAIRLLDVLRDRDPHPFDRTWISMIRGIAHESLNQPLQAEVEYDRARDASGRAELLLAMLWRRQEVKNSAQILRRAIDRNRGHSIFPLWASASELREAEQLLAGGSS